MSERLPTGTTDRGFEHHHPIPSTYGGGVAVHESSAASGPHIWVSAEAPLGPGKVGTVEADRVEAPLHLRAAHAWALARQLAALVVRHYQGDARLPGDIGDAGLKLAGAANLTPEQAGVLMARLLGRGLVLVDINVQDANGARPAAVAAPAALTTAPAPAYPTTEEPDTDHAMVAVLNSKSDPEDVYIRDAKSAAAARDEDDEDDGARWYKMGADYLNDDAGPYTWAEVHTFGTIVRLRYDTPTG